MFGRREDTLYTALLDDLAALHDADLVGDLADDPEIVGDEKHGHPETRLDVLEQFQDLRLHGDVERRRRFVGNEQIGLIRQCHRDHHPLTLAAGELVRIAFKTSGRIGNADLIKQIEDTRSRCLTSNALMQF